MTQDEAESLARIAQQAHEGFAFLAHASLPSNQCKAIADLTKDLGLSGNYMGMAFAFTALAFLYVFDGAFKPLGGPVDLENIVDESVFAITTTPKLGNAVRGGGATESSKESILRHLRNCFMHNRWKFDAANLRVQVLDYSGSGPTATCTFDAEVDAGALVELAEKLLIKAHRLASAIARGAVTP